MQLALHDAGLATTDIRQINAHGTSTPLNDAAEAAAVTAVFGPGGVPVTSTKGVTGHALGAAGALEAAAVLLSMEHALIPPTAGTMQLDDGFEIVEPGQNCAWSQENPPPVPLSPLAPGITPLAPHCGALEPSNPGFRPQPRSGPENF